MLLMFYLFLGVLIIILVLTLFNLASKSCLWDMEGGQSFECGYTSYFFSHNSFSMHYFMVGLVFLFLDLELCLLMPFFMSDYSSMKTLIILEVFILILVSGILYEWKMEKLDWKFWA